MAEELRKAIEESNLYAEQQRMKKEEDSDSEFEKDEAKVRNEGLEKEFLSRDTDLLRSGKEALFPRADDLLQEEEAMATHSKEVLEQGKFLLQQVNDLVEQGKELVEKGKDAIEEVSSNLQNFPSTTPSSSLLKDLHHEFIEAEQEARIDDEFRRELRGKTDEDALKAAAEEVKHQIGDQGDFNKAQESEKAFKIPAVDDLKFENPTADDESRLTARERETVNVGFHGDDNKVSCDLNKQDATLASMKRDSSSLDDFEHVEQAAIISEQMRDYGRKQEEEQQGKEGENAHDLIDKRAVLGACFTGLHSTDIPAAPPSSSFIDDNSSSSAGDAATSSAISNIKMDSNLLDMGDAFPDRKEADDKLDKFLNEFNPKEQRKEEEKEVNDVKQATQQFLQGEYGGGLQTQSQFHSSDDLLDKYSDSEPEDDFKQSFESEEFKKKKEEFHDFPVKSTASAFHDDFDEFMDTSSKKAATSSAAFMEKDDDFGLPKYEIKESVVGKFEDANSKLFGKEDDESFSPVFRSNNSNKKEDDGKKDYVADDDLFAKKKVPEKDDEDIFKEFKSFDAPSSKPTIPTSDVKIEEKKEEKKQKDPSPVSVPVPATCPISFGSSKKESGSSGKKEGGREVVGAEAIFCKMGLDAWFKPECLNPKVESLIYWRDPKKSGPAFGGVLVVLLALTYFSLISVVAYLSLFALGGTLSFRIYKNIVQAVQKTGDGHPFKEFLALDLALSQEKVKEISEVAVAHVNATVTELRRLFLVEDIVDSLKFAALLWCLTYLGSWFNGMTLIIIGWVALFTLPKVYETNKTQIDANLDIVRTKLAEITSKVKAAVPIGKKAAVEEKKEQ